MYNLPKCHFGKHDKSIQVELNWGVGSRFSLIAQMKQHWCDSVLFLYSFEAGALHHEYTVISPHTFTHVFFPNFYDLYNIE